MIDFCFISFFCADFHLQMLQFTELSPHTHFQGVLLQGAFWPSDRT